MNRLQRRWRGQIYKAVAAVVVSCVGCALLLIVVTVIPVWRVPDGKVTSEIYAGPPYLVRTQNTIKVFADTGSKEFTLARHVYCLAASWSPMGGLFCAVGKKANGSNSLVRIGADSYETISDKIPRGTTALYSSNEGAVLAFFASGGGGRQVVLYMLETDSWFRVPVTIPYFMHSNVSFSPCDTVVAFTGSDVQIHLYDIEARKERVLDYHGRAAFVSERELCIIETSGTPRVIVLNTTTLAEKELEVRVKGLEQVTNMSGFNGFCLVGVPTLWKSQELVLIDTEDGSTRVVCDVSLGSHFELMKGPLQDSQPGDMEKRSGE